MLTAITTEEASKAAFDNLCRTFGAAVGVQDGDEMGFPRVLRFPHPLGDFWVKLEPYHNRFGCSYGIPADGDLAQVTCEINPPRENKRHKCLLYGGMFARENNDVHLCHTGTISYGRTRFKNQYQGEWTDVIIENQVVDVIDIGRINDPDLLINIACFVREISRIKREMEHDPRTWIKDPESFVPEFSGSRRGYAQTAPIESDVQHGYVVEALANAVIEANQEPCNDQHRDLFVKNNGQMSVLFEVKTKTETTDIYQAIGQLMFHGRARRAGVKMVLVIPDKPKKDTAMRLDQLKIKILRYKWKKEKPVFHQDDVEQLLL